MPASPILAAILSKGELPRDSIAYCVAQGIPVDWEAVLLPGPQPVVTQYGVTLAHVAAMAGSLDALRRLQAAGGDLGATDHAGFTVLHHAVLAGASDLLSWVLATGFAAADARNAWGGTYRDLELMIRGDVEQPSGGATACWAQCAGGLRPLTRAQFCALTGAQYTTTVACDATTLAWHWLHTAVPGATPEDSRVRRAYAAMQRGEAAAADTAPPTVYLAAVAAERARADCGRGGELQVRPRPIIECGAVAGGAAASADAPASASASDDPETASEPCSKSAPDDGGAIGYGVFAGRPIRRGEVVCEYVGVLVGERAPGRASDYYISPVDGLHRRGVAAMVNDGPPNCAAVNLWGVGGLPKRTVFLATEDIAPHEQLCINYGPEHRVRHPSFRYLIARPGALRHFHAATPMDQLVRRAQEQLSVARSLAQPEAVADVNQFFYLLACPQAVVHLVLCGVLDLGAWRRALEATRAEDLFRLPGVVLDLLQRLIAAAGGRDRLRALQQRNAGPEAVSPPRAENGPYAHANAASRPEHPAGSESDDGSGSGAECGGEADEDAMPAGQIRVSDAVGLLLADVGRRALHSSVMELCLLLHRAALAFGPQRPTAPS